MIGSSATTPKSRSRHNSDLSSHPAGAWTLIDFFYTLRAAKLKVSVKEFLTLLQALQMGVIDDDGGPSVDKFY